MKGKIALWIIEAVFIIWFLWSIVKMFWSIG